MTSPNPGVLREKLTERKLARLSLMRHKRIDLRQAYSLKINQRVYLPSQWQDTPHRGTVTAVEPHRFRVTWDMEDRRSGQSRDRLWYPWSEAHHFQKEA